MTWQRAAAIAGVLTFLILVGGGFLKYHNQFAMADEVKQVTRDFRYYVISNQAAALQQRMWQLEDRHQCEVNKMPQSSKEEYRRLQTERVKLLKQMDTLAPKGKQ